MNKLLALFIIAVSMFVCDPPLNSGAKFRIKNQTDMKLNIALGGTYIILPAGKTHTIKAHEDYNNIFDHEIARLNICSVFSDETMLRTWRHSQRNDGGKQFFNEFSWTRGRESDDGDIYVTYTFVITPEDLGLQQ